MTDRTRVIILLGLLCLLFVAYFVTVQFIIGSCVEVGRYQNGQPIFDCSLGSGSLTLRNILVILPFGR